MAGGGASGLMAAVVSARAGARTLLLELNDRPGVKLALTGGGRCNVLPRSEPSGEYVTTSSANSLKRILAGWSVREAARFFRVEAGMEPTPEQGTGNLFLGSGGAAMLARRLAGMAAEAGAEILTGVRVASIEPGGAVWRIGTGGGAGFEACSVVLATGGRSWPWTGSSGRGYALAERLGHTVRRTFPALVPLLRRSGVLGGLDGIVVDAALRSSFGGRKVSSRGSLLFTKDGFSGPAAMNISHCVSLPSASGSEPPEVRACWLPEAAGAAMAELSSHGGTLGGFLRAALPARLSSALISMAGLDPGKPACALDREARAAMQKVLLDCPLDIGGDSGWRKAETTGGGVALEEVESHTLESRLHPGLYFTGEMLDAFGPVGGWNLYWAWLTGRAAGLAAAARRRNA
ncbi:aminoacetone oxidase family FAD-binding enzyme [Candidatus Fermentibacteria bacterium]|nr:aminoacetone oxidase family FAD-binding enzyme [Candidatus Fermentibacteria bacterium]